ncbi:hypothetical protein ACCT30_22110 [Rhizobium ruizarguesonis]|jgi:hypothetical protein
MNALNAQGNMAGRPGGDGHPARAATGILPARQRAFCPREMNWFAALFHTLSSS